MHFPGRRAEASVRFARWRAASPAGLSLLETLLVVSVASVLMAIAVPSVDVVLTDARANAAMRAAQGHLRAARDEAMKARRVIEVSFSGSNRLDTTRLDGSIRTVTQITVLEHGMVFRLTPGLPDTPDAFGQGAAVDFGGPLRVYFQPGGSMTDEQGLPVSGTVFLGTPTRTLSARAVTVLGPTGRVEAYRWDGVAWR